MRILVVGAGAIGSNLADQLSQEGHDIGIVEADAATVRRMTEKMDVLAVRGNGASPLVLEQAGIDKSEMVIAVTDSDEMNIIVCLLANEYGVATKIARIRNPDYTDVNAVLKLESLGVDRIINPEEITVTAMCKLLEEPGAVEVADFAEGEITLRGFDVPEDSPIGGGKLVDIRQNMAAEEFLIVAIERRRNGKPQVIIPRGDDIVEPHDHIYVLTTRDMLPILRPMLYRRRERVNRVVLYGASRVGRQLAKRVGPLYREVVLIEPDEALAERAAGELEDTLVLNGDATDPDVLDDAHIAHADFFVATSRDDQRNLMATLQARQAGTGKAMVMVHEPTHVPIVDSLDVDVVINPRLLTVGEILRHVRRGMVVSVARIGDGAAEVIELIAEAGSKIIDTPIRDLDVPENVLIGAILREERMHIPDGNSKIQAGEKVVVFALAEAVEAAQAMFAGA